MFSGIRYRLETSRIEKSTLFEERFLTRAVTRRIRLATRQQVCHDATSIDNTGYGPHMLYRESRRLGHTTSYGFLALALIILAQMAFSGWTLQRMYREMSSTLISLSDIQIESLELKSLLGDVRRFEKDILLASTGDRNDIDLAEARWADSLRKAQEQLQKIRKEVDEHRGQVTIDTTAIDQAIGYYVRGVREFLPKLKENILSPSKKPTRTFPTPKAISTSLPKSSTASSRTQRNTKIRRLNVSPSSARSSSRQWLRLALLAWYLASPSPFRLRGPACQSAGIWSTRPCTTPSPACSTGVAWLPR